MTKQKYLLADFECPSCENKIKRQNYDGRLTAPTKCVCGRRGRFKFLGVTAIYDKGLVKNLGIKLNFLMSMQRGEKIDIYTKTELVLKHKCLWCRADIEREKETCDSTCNRNVNVLKKLDRGFEQSLVI